MNTQGQRMRKGVRRDAKRAFLCSYARNPIVLRAIVDAGCSRSAFYLWLKQDALFNKKYQALTAYWYLPRWDNYPPTNEEIRAYRKQKRYGERLQHYYAASH